MIIDYEKIGKAISYYKKNNFQYVEVPWTAQTDIVMTTMPSHGVIVKALWPSLGLLNLIGSAEQSFLQIVKDYSKDLLSGKYVACSPCFRDDEQDWYHSKYFMKVELFITDDTSYTELIRIVDVCRNFFAQYIPCHIINTEQGYDIVDSKYEVELGSYGIRENNQVKWIYATGLAEPRLSLVMDDAYGR